MKSCSYSLLIFAYPCYIELAHGSPHVNKTNDAILTIKTKLTCLKLKKNISRLNQSEMIFSACVVHALSCLTEAFFQAGRHVQLRFGSCGIYGANYDPNNVGTFSDVCPFVKQQVSPKLNLGISSICNNGFTNDQLLEIHKRTC